MGQHFFHHSNLCLKIVHKPGNQNVVADAISRRLCLVAALQEDRPQPRERKYARNSSDGPGISRLFYTFSSSYHTTTVLPMMLRVRMREPRRARGKGTTCGSATLSTCGLILPLGQDQARLEDLRARRATRKDILMHLPGHILAGQPGVDRTRINIREHFGGQDWTQASRHFFFFWQPASSAPRQKSPGLLQPSEIPGAP